MANYFKVYNTDPKDLNLNVLNTYISIPANGSVIVSEVVKQQLEINHAQLEIVEATLEQYQAYRLECDEVERKKAEAIEASKKQALEVKVEQVVEAPTKKKGRTTK